MTPASRDSRSSFNPPIFSGVIACLLAGVLAAGCSGPKAADKVVIRGSNTVGEELAPGLITEYKKLHPGVVFDLESKGTGYGFGNLIVGAADIAAASRKVNEFELRQTQLHGVELNDYIIGAYSVAVVVNANNPIANLTKDQVRDLFTGSVTNWNDVGGPNAPVHIYIRDPISGTHLGFKELAMENKSYALDADTFTNYEGIIEAVASDANGIGYSSFNLINATGVKSVTVGRIAPTTESVHKGDYPYARVLRLYTNKLKESQPAQDFIQYVLSTEGQQVVTRLGYVPRS
jgi:phosphate transport system substrate-binding protein